MDNDQEVVREPFEGDDRSLRSLNQSSDDKLREDNDIAQMTDFQNYDNVRNNDQSNKGSYTDSLDQTEYKYNERIESSSDDDNSSSSYAEDVNFAESFGINLKSRSVRNDLTIDKLLEAAAESSSTSVKPKPIIETSVTSDCIYHKGTFYQKGDIVALCDQDDGQVYFAQLTGFLQDQYCEKSASVNWLVPIKPTSREFFDPSAYKIGLEDTHLRKLDCMTFVRHCPHDYYIRRFFQFESQATTVEENPDGQSLALSRSKKNQNYIWTTMKPCRVPTIDTQ